MAGGTLDTVEPTVGSLTISQYNACENNVNKRPKLQIKID